MLLTKITKTPIATKSSIIDCPFRKKDEVISLLKTYPPYSINVNCPSIPIIAYNNITYY